jgi:hyperosmotically inducible protein
LPELDHMRALLILVSLIASTAVHAQRGEPGGGARAAQFSALDRNRDGFVTRIEALAESEIHKRFAQFDTNKDRQLSLAEYLTAREDMDQRAQQDAALTARVKAALIAERGLPWTGITVETYEGGVQLSGFVPAPDLASRAGRVTAGVSGVRTVHNNLVVRPK